MYFVEDSNVPIISQEMFDQAQALRKQRHRMGKVQNSKPLAGKLYCGSCGTIFRYKAVNGIHQLRRFVSGIGAGQTVIFNWKSCGYLTGGSRTMFLSHAAETDFPHRRQWWQAHCTRLSTNSSAHSAPAHCASESTPAHSLCA